jgi:signal transduction histidine kinase
MPPMPRSFRPNSLAICRRIVERHGGGITAQSRPGQGSTFIVKLPKSVAGNAST